mgnify:FL=1|tara:strand:- start:83 stop:649 length:567 start_codon:yes stop_codon:yes gene_type:complete
MLEDIFKTSIYHTKLSIDLEKLNKDINKIIDKDKGREISNSGGYQSNNIDYKSFTQIYFLSEIVTIEAKQYKTLLGLKEDCVFDNIWINVNKNKDFNITHIHPSSNLSGVFYVKVPKNSGKIVFENPFLEHISYSWEQEIFNYNNYTSPKWSIEPEENKLLLFPSFLRHYVKPNLTNEERISLSFNIK